MYETKGLGLQQNATHLVVHMTDGMCCDHTLCMAEWTGTGRLWVALRRTGSGGGPPPPGVARQNFAADSCFTPPHPRTCCLLIPHVRRRHYAEQCRPIEEPQSTVQAMAGAMSAPSSTTALEQEGATSQSVSTTADRLLSVLSGFRECAHTLCRHPPRRTKKFVLTSMRRSGPAWMKGCPSTRRISAGRKGRRRRTGWRRNRRR